MLYFLNGIILIPFVVNNVVFVEELDVSLGSLVGTLEATSSIVDRKTRYFVSLGMNGHPK
jgi:hypothetical protein